jgi:hypothetical protein
VNIHVYEAMADELEKTALLSLRDVLGKITDLFRSEESKAKRRVDYHFSPKAGPEKWDKFLKNVRSKDFVKLIQDNPLADEQLKAHAASLHALSRSKTVGKVESAKLPGMKYEIRELPDGSLGCTCPDWRFVGSLKPGYECKHIRAFKEGKTKAASVGGLLSFLARNEYNTKVKPAIAQARRRARANELRSRDDSLFR